MRASGPLLDILIVTSPGDHRYLPDCLSSLERYPLTLGDMTITVVDNSTGEDVDRVLVDRFPRVRHRPMGWNAGFCLANNAGLRETTSPFALLLNPDTEFVEEGSLDHLVGLLEKRGDIGMVGCRLVRRDGTFDHAAKRSFPTPLGALAHFTGIGRRETAPARLAQYRAPLLDERGSGEVDAINGAFMLARRAVVDEVGLLDEGYWLYMEDLDWCYRFKQAGWKVWYEGGTTVIHVKGGGTKQRGHRGVRLNYAFHRSMARFYRKFYAGERRTLDVAIYAAIAVKFGASAVRSAVARRL